MGYRDLRAVLASGVAVMAVVVATPAMAQVRMFNVPAQSAATGIPALAKQADIQLLVSVDAVSGKTIRAVKGRMTVDEAIRRVMDDASLRVVNSDGRTYTLAPREMRRPVSSLPEAAVHAVQTAPQYDEIIVTAQKKEESIRDVPIAMSAFSAEVLDEYKIEGGSELLRAVPNVNFSKTNFASYNFSIRGIGTKALAASTDPAVAISFNNTPMIRNRLFEQEYFDVQRVEVLRGPQGTLYGRNATGGVVNMITNKPEYEVFDGYLKAEVGNFESRRLGGMVNVPLGDNFALRAAGAMTKRDGYDYNSYTKKRVNGRDLWSTRVSAAWSPADSFKVTAIWEHFEEDDDRSRTGKQLCHRDDGPTRVGSVDITNLVNTRGMLSQGCLPKSIYDDGAFGVPNGLSLAQVVAVAGASLGYTAPSGSPSRRLVPVINPGVDPYEGLVQSRNLREIHTQYDPVFRAKNDVYQLNLDWSVSDQVTLFSQTSYTTDRYYSTQDFNRFVSNDIFNNSIGLYNGREFNSWYEGMTPNGVFTDPQLGPSKKMSALDMVRSKSDQYYQEFRALSNFDGPFNFNIGANYTEFKIEEDYFVFNNIFTALSHVAMSPRGGGAPLVDCDTYVVNYLNCSYVDPNPLESINGEGHNYFRSRNVAKTESYGLYGEMYWNLRDDLKLTAGLRYTDDKKTATPYKSQLLLAPGFLAGGLVGRGSPADPDIVQKWGRLTGRVVLDWKPDVSFANDLLVYGSYSRGYKGGGANPPGIGFDPDKLKVFQNPLTFGPEAVNAFEVGVKGASVDRSFTFSASAFYYDYSGYQVSQIVDRLALNENFDSKMWGMDIELGYYPAERLKLNANIGYLKSRINGGEESIDVMNRTQGSPDWFVVKPWFQLSSNCVAPASLIEKIITHPTFVESYSSSYFNKICGGSYMGDFRPGQILANQFGVSYDPLVDGPNQGRGFMAPLGGNELPNAPRWTMSLAAQYTIPMGSWNAVLGANYYKQAKSWARVYNTEIDRLRSWDNFNLSVAVDNEDIGLSLQFYVKNVFDKTSITDIFLNSDDSPLTANVFTTDPRLIGFSVSKTF